MQYAKKAGYLISNTTAPADFIVIIKFRSSDEVWICDFVCCSAFVQAGLTKNQQSWSALIIMQLDIAVL